MFDYIIDSHCHLDLLEQKGFDIDKVVAEAMKNEVKILQTICTRISKIEEILRFSDKYENVYASCGIHPNNTSEEPEIKAAEIVKICQSHKKIIGIGETGLDYYYDYSDVTKQKNSFLEHIYAAQETALPLIIHSRNADKDMMEILVSEQKNKSFPALLHCFSSSEELAKKALDLGIKISISGIVTFKNATELQEIVKKLPLEALLVETDAPYLAPMPHRGQINQPAYTRNVVEYVAQIKGITFKQVADATTRSFFEIFKMVDYVVVG